MVSLYKNKQESSHLAQLYKRYSHLVYGLCLKYFKNEENAKDGTMDIFEMLPAQLLKHDVQNFKSWLYSVAKNHCLMELRKQKGIYEINAEEKIANLVMESEDELHLLEEKELSLTKLEAGIKELKEEQRTCVELFYLKQKSYAQVVSETGYSLKNVKSYIQNGKRNLKSYLNNHGVKILTAISSTIHIFVNQFIK